MSGSNDPRRVLMLSWSRDQRVCGLKPHGREGMRTGMPGLASRADEIMQASPDWTLTTAGEIAENVVRCNNNAYWQGETAADEFISQLRPI